MQVTIFYTKWEYWYEPWYKLWWHDDARVIEADSRTYKEISNIRSDIEEVREEAKKLIIQLLNKYE